MIDRKSRDLSPHDRKCRRLLLRARLYKNMGCFLKHGVKLIISPDLSRLENKDTLVALGKPRPHLAALVDTSPIGPHHVQSGP